MKTLRLRIVSPERVAFDEEVRSVRFQGIDGSYGIRPGHAPLMTATAPGCLEITRTEGATPEKMLVTDGFAEVRDNVLTIAADVGEHAHEIDIDKAREAEKHARDLLSNKATMAEEDVLKAEEQLRHAMLRQLIGQRVGGSVDL